MSWPRLIAFGFRTAHCSASRRSYFFSGRKYERSLRPNQTIKPTSVNDDMGRTAPVRRKLGVFAKIPCRGLSLFR